MDHTEIEVRFLDIDKNALVKKLLALGAKDLGEELLSEIIFYDAEHTWPDQHRLVRIRNGKDGIYMTYKHHQTASVYGTHEVEIPVTSIEIAKAFLEGIGLTAFRHQEKKRHTFTMDNVTLDFDTWPNIPTYLELEGQSEQNLKDAVLKLHLDWVRGDFTSARAVIENKYGILVSKLKVYTFKEQR